MCKRTNLLIAYCLLATVSGGVIAYDASCRRELSTSAAHHHEATTPAFDNPLPITPLAESPFLQKKQHAQNRLPLAVVQPAPKTVPDEKRRIASFIRMEK